MKLYDVDSIFDGYGALFNGKSIGEIFYFFPGNIEFYMMYHDDFVIKDIGTLLNHGTLLFCRNCKKDFVHLLQLYGLCESSGNYKGFVKNLPTTRYKFKKEALARNYQKLLLYDLMYKNNYGKF